ncbi:MAG TPA: methylmalonyl Co-A mutase-associated GTPase MeaB [Polyangiaceae bacterium]|jgi:LAO/AO transport system kinase|nr:methylmalonyl Co-A mutase-associated GTPase MeaB [Polyangiaceae bacterium]
MAAQDQILAGVLAGDVRALARACRMVDERWPGHHELLSSVFPHSRSSWWVGITGSPGVGKSTITSRLIQHLRAQGQRVGVVAVDPSSPFSGGALLGDRIRMQAHWDDPEVFIRSLATRGALGGLSRTSADVARLLSAWGAGVVLIETVGVGQDEIEVMHVAHSTLVLQAPGGGDDLQAAKAGLLECADVFAVNKADLPGADSAAQHLRGMLALAGISAGASGPGGHSGGHSGHRRPALGSAPAGSTGWEVPVLKCVAQRDEGIAEVLAALQAHHTWLTNSAEGRARQVERLRGELRVLLRERLNEWLFERQRGAIEALAERVSRGEIDPYAAVQSLLGSAGLV